MPAPIPPADDAPPTEAAQAKPPSGPQRAMERLGLVTPMALALHLPLRYEDETRLTPVAQVRPGQVAQVDAVVRDARVEQRGRRQLVVQVQDDAGDELVLRFLHFYPSHQKSLQPGARVRVRGEARVGMFGREMVHPAFKVVDEHTPLAASLTPVYPASAQLPQAYLRKAVAGGLQRAMLNELLPAGTVPAGLPPLRDALRFLHHPPPSASLAQLEDHTHPAWQRLKFEELLAQQLSQMQARRERALLQAPPLQPEAGGLRDQFVQVLPFALTDAQQRVVDEITADLALPQPMHRLLQGDVGSGKTVVAALAACAAMDAGWQCALMAPTEILAEQHFAKLVQWLTPLGVQVAWLSGSRKGKQRK
ncbi:MAG: DEAD/DEAH box helicase, partial [Vitreoscilla sp.]|nr:DEAD/DEAH box helicase [Vitreoscilla sp.]